MEWNGTEWTKKKNQQHENFFHLIFVRMLRAVQKNSFLLE